MHDASLDRPCAFLGGADATGWYTRVDGQLAYVVQGERVDRQAFLNFCGENNLDPLVLDERRDS